jgi:tetratricopeptide (TPR) repeat protein
MSFRFWRRIRLAPGVTLNLSKSTTSLSLGPRGAKYTISPRGNRATAGLTGTGLFYTVHDRKRARRGGPAPAPSVPQRDRLKLGFFQRLITPANEQRFIDGIRALSEGDQTAALAALEGAHDLPDAAWMAGMIRLRREELDSAKKHFRYSLSRLDDLGTLFAKYDIAAQASLPITSDIFAHVFPRERGTRLALVEIAQLEGRHDDAMVHLERLMELDPTDPVVLVSFAELALDTPDDRALMDRVVRATVNVENETPVDTAILLYRARALAALGMSDAAIDVFTLANRRRKDRPEGLLHQIRYDRAVLYDHVGRNAQARREFERLYAADPSFEDVAERLGFTATTATFSASQP